MHRYRLTFAILTELIGEISFEIPFERALCLNEEFANRCESMVRNATEGDFLSHAIHSHPFGKQAPQVTLAQPAQGLCKSG